MHVLQELWLIRRLVCRLECVVCTVCRRRCHCTGPNEELHWHALIVFCACSGERIPGMNVRFHTCDHTNSRMHKMAAAEERLALIREAGGKPRWAPPRPPLVRAPNVDAKVPRPHPHSALNSDPWWPVQSVQVGSMIDLFKRLYSYQYVYLYMHM